METLKAELTEWHRDDPYVITSNSDADGSRYGFVIEIKKQPHLERWSLIAGDCVHNLRSALDTALYGVAIRDSGINPPPNADRLQFPICDKAADFATQMSRRKMTNLSAKAQAWIERAQPYNRLHKSKPPILKLLAEFDNLDKHRLLNVVLQHLSEREIKCKGSSLVGHVANHHFFRGAVESGMEVASVAISPPKTNLEFKFSGSVTVTVSHSPGPSGEGISSLHDVLAGLITEVKRILDDAI